MSINNYLCDLASTLVLSDIEKNGINTSVETIKKRLSYYSTNIVEKTVFGSYTRGTILPRKADSNSDIDIMVVFSNPYLYQPQTFLNKLKDFAETYYTKSEIYQSSPTIVLELNHIKFELVPAYKNIYGTYRIPKNSSEWQDTYPNLFNNTLLECNKNNDYKIKPVIRLLKHWNIQKNYRDMASFKLEKEIADQMKYSYISCSSYTDYVKKALETIKYYTNCSRVDTAIKTINEAIDYEKTNMPYTALSTIKKVFPEV